MKLPKGVPLVESTKLEFLNLDNVLHAGKKDRKHRVWGYVSVIYSDALDLLFLKNGEPFNAARLTPKTRKIMPINNVVQRAKETNLGILSVYSVEEVLLRMIIATIKSKPIKSDIEGDKIKLDLMLKKLEEKGFNGFLHLKRGLEESFIHFEKGSITGAYVAGNQDKLKDKNRIADLFSSIPNMSIDIYEREEADDDQASPAMIEMLFNVYSKMFQDLSDTIGESLVVKSAIRARATVQNDYPFLKSVKINPDLSLSGEVMADSNQLIEAFANWLNIMLNSLSTFLGDEAGKIIKKSLVDYRFVLKSAGFFKIANIDID